MKEAEAAHRRQQQQVLTPPPAPEASSSADGEALGVPATEDPVFEPARLRAEARMTEKLGSMVFYVEDETAAAREIRSAVRDSKDSNTIAFFIEAVTSKTSRVPE